MPPRGRMKTKYNVYLVTVTPVKKNRRWAGEAWIAPSFEISGALRDHWKTAGWVSQREAEEACRRWAKIRIDRWIAIGK